MTSNRFSGHFLIVDTGHPMTLDSVLLIKKTVQNVLSLASSIRDVSRIPVFGFGTLSPSFRIIQQWKILTGNFVTIDRNLECLTNPSNLGAKVTYKDYRSFLETSIENIVTDFEFYGNEWKSNTETKEKFNPLHYWPTQMQVTLITRKGGSLILEILKTFQNYSAKLRRIDIVEISNPDDTKPCILKNHMNFISHITVTETIYDLDGIFKRWILGDDTHCEQLKIVLNKESGIHIKCEMNDCLINPAITTLPNAFTLSSISPSLIMQKPLYVPVNKPSTHEMEVINKIGINDLCPSIFFGFPQWIYPTTTCITNWDEFRYNHEIFRALCHQLTTADIGLLTRLKSSPSSSPFNKITPLYFIISDGMRLLMKNIIPIELQLPQRPERVMTSRAVDDVEEEANDLVRSLIEQIKMDDFTPQILSTGVYEHFTEHLKSELKKTTGKSVKSGCEFIPKAKSTKTVTFQRPDISPGEYIPKFLSESKSKSPAEPVPVKAPKKCKKAPRKRTIEEPIHPALMSPGTMAKYRKHNSDYYELPEVMEPGVMEN